MEATSDMNSVSPCLDSTESTFTATTVPSSSLPFKIKYPFFNKSIKFLCIYFEVIRINQTKAYKFNVKIKIRL